MAKKVKVLATGLTGYLDSGRWNKNRGFGFIRLDQESVQKLGEDTLFVHVSDLPDEVTEGSGRQRRLKNGKRAFAIQLTFNADKLPDGRRRASWVKSVDQERREKEEATKTYLETRHLGKLRFQPNPVVWYKRKTYRVPDELVTVAETLGSGHVSFRFGEFPPKHTVDLHGVTERVEWKWGNSDHRPDGVSCYYPGVKRITHFHDAESKERLGSDTPAYWDTIQKPSDLILLGEKTDVTFEALEEVILQLGKCLNGGLLPWERGYWSFGSFGVPDWIVPYQPEDLPDWLAEKVQQWPPELLEQWAIERDQVWEGVEPSPMPTFVELPEFLARIKSGEFDPLKEIESYSGFSPEAPELIEKAIQEILSRWEEPEFIGKNEHLMLRLIGIPERTREAVAFIMTCYGTLVEDWGLRIAGELYGLAWEVFRQAKSVKMTQGAAYRLAVQSGFAVQVEGGSVRFFPKAYVHSTDDFFLFRFEWKGRIYLCWDESEEHKFEARVVEFMPALPHFYLDLTGISDLIAQPEAEVQRKASAALLTAIGALKKK